MQPSRILDHRPVGHADHRFLIALVSASFVVFVGQIIIAVRHGRAIRNVAANDQGIAYERENTAVTGTITDIVIAGPGVPINGFCSTTPDLWIVRLKVERCVKGVFLSPVLNVLTHSPSLDLRARSVGQRLTLRLKAASGHIRRCPGLRIVPGRLSILLISKIFTRSGRPISNPVADNS